MRPDLRFNDWHQPGVDEAELEFTVEAPPRLGSKHRLGSEFFFPSLEEAPGSCCWDLVYKRGLLLALPPQLQVSWCQRNHSGCAQVAARGNSGGDVCRGRPLNGRDAGGACIHGSVRKGGQLDALPEPETEIGADQVSTVSALRKLTADGTDCYGSRGDSSPPSDAPVGRCVSAVTGYIPPGR